MPISVEDFQWPAVLRFCSNETVDDLRDQRARAASRADFVRLTIECAWHVRHRDTNLATALAREALNQSASNPAAAPLSISETAWLNLALAEAALLHGTFESCQGFLDEAKALFTSDGNRLGLCEVSFIEANMASDDGDYPRRDTALRCSLDAAMALGDEQRVLTARLNLHALELLTDPERIGAAEIADAKANRASSIPGVAYYANSFLCYVALSENNFAAGIEYGLVAQTCAQNCGLIRRAIAQASQVGLAYIDLGDPAAAVQHLEPTLQVARERGWPQPLSTILSTLAYAMGDLGRTELATELAQEAVEALRSSPGSKNYLSALNALASLELKQGLHEAAVRRYEQILNAPSIADIIELRPYALLGLGEAHLQADRAHEAAAYAQQANEFAQGRNDAPVRIEALRLLARIATSVRASNAERPAKLDDPLAYLREAQRVTQGCMQPEKADELMTEVSRELAGKGQFEEALAALQKAVAHRQSQTTVKAQRTAVVTEIRMKTSRALSEAARQRDLAAAEALRAADLEALNQQLRHAMEELQTTQQLLIRRNDELNAAYAKISELSVTDPLTGLKNRRFFSQIIEADVARCIRGYVQSKFGELDTTFSEPRTDLVFFLVDVDHFKSVNDQYGHSAGDAILVQLKDRLLATVRAEDYVVRWGGEEFLVVARGLSRGLAAELAERLRAAVAESPFKIPDALSIKKTCSIGFAVFPQDDRFPTRGGWQEAVEAADARLYRAKQSGRDRWVGDDRAIAD